MTTIEEYVKERNEALANLDMDWARKMIPQASSDEVRLCAMHKARCEVSNMDEKLKKESADWLSDRGYSRLSHGKI